MNLNTIWSTLAANMDILSNGVLNLTPDKTATLAEWHRILKPGGRLQVGDILVERSAG